MCVVYIVFVLYNYGVYVHVFCIAYICICVYVRMYEFGMLIVVILYELHTYFAFCSVCI